VVAGESHTCALLASGAVLCWGSNASGQLGPGPGAPIASGATTLVAGARHACALVGGAVQCWGDDASGQLGGTPAAGIATPIPSGITLLAASTLQTCASIATSPGGNIDPVLQCWGAGLGAGFLPADPQPTPAIPMKDPTQSTVRFSLDGIAIGRAHACVQKAGEFVHCFGPDDSLGQLGASGVPAGSREEWLVTGNLSATALAAGRDHTCALLAPGRLRCWGANERGQLGDGTTVTPAPGTISIPSGR
jgi:alpha-tubulin suppressor-like RCC1 family protein